MEVEEREVVDKVFGGDKEDEVVAVAETAEVVVVYGVVGKLVAVVVYQVYISVYI